MITELALVSHLSIINNEKFSLSPALYGFLV